MDNTQTAGDLRRARVSYTVGALDEAELADTPLAQLLDWYAQARAAASGAEPNAMTLATVGLDGIPSARTVLLKEADARGLVFYTNYSSRKGRELAGHAGAAAVLPWLAQQRQVAVRGPVERVPAHESAAYFRSRPWASRVGAWASAQSDPVAGRAPLEARYAELAERWPDLGGPDDVPVPPHWGGFLLRPVEVEFWQGRPSRLHDRLVFVALRPGAALDDAATWRVERRQP